MVVYACSLSFRYIFVLAVLVACKQLACNSTCACHVMTSQCSVLLLMCANAIQSTIYIVSYKQFRISQLTHTHTHNAQHFFM